MALQLRRGTDAQRLTVLPQAGELIFTTDNKALFIGDGVTTGGINVLASAFPANNPSGLIWNSITNTVNFNLSVFSSITTTNVLEGTNKYYTTARGVGDVYTAFQNGVQTGISFNYNAGTNALSATVTGGGSSLPSTTGNIGKFLTINGAGQAVWATAPLAGLQVPSQPGYQGSYLTTDGTNLIWADVAINTLSTGTHFVTLNEATGYLTLSGNLQLPQGADITRYNGAAYVSVLNGLISSVQQDTNPKLGGNLDLNGNQIRGTAGSISISGSITSGTLLLTTGLGAALSLNGYNIIGASGAINISGSISGGAITGTSVLTSSLQASLGANLNLNAFNIIGTGNINTTGSITNYSSLSNSAAIIINGPIIQVPQGSFNNNTIQFQNTNLTVNTDLADHDLGVTIQGSANGLFTSSTISFNTSRNTVMSPLTVQNGDSLLSLLANAYNGSSSLFSGAAAMIVDGVIGTRSVGTLFSVVTTNGVDTVVERIAANYRLQYTSNGIFIVPHNVTKGYNVVNSSKGAITSSTTYASISGVSVSAAATYSNIRQDSTSGSGFGASFQVQKTGGGTGYSGVTTITVISQGGGYATGDTVTIAGTSLGGSSPTNDLTFTLNTYIKTGIGYDTGAGGSVTQSISKATFVSLNKSTGIITLNNAALAGNTVVSFTFNNTTIGANDMVLINHSAAGTLGAYGFAVTPALGSCTVYVRNNSSASLSEAIVLQFAVIKSAMA